MPLSSLLVGIPALVVLLLIANSLVRVSENQRGGLVRLGRYTKTLRPGLHVRVPLFDVVTKVDLDASIPGWQGLSDAQLEAAVEKFVTLGALGRSAPVSGGARPPSPRSPGTAQAQALADWLLEAASTQSGVDLSKDAMAKDRIAKCAESALAELRSSGSSEINLPFLTANADGPKHFALSLTRAQVEKLLGSRLG